jgi:hypothetical protein
MDKFILKHQFVDGRTDEVCLENSMEFEADSLETEFCSGGNMGILDRLETFLRGSGFNFDGHLTIVEEDDDEESGGE